MHQLCHIEFHFTIPLFNQMLYFSTANGNTLPVWPMRQLQGHSPDRRATGISRLVRADAGWIRSRFQDEVCGRRVRGVPARHEERGRLRSETVEPVHEQRVRDL